MPNPYALITAARHAAATNPQEGHRLLWEALRATANDGRGFPRVAAHALLTTWTHVLGEDTSVPPQSFTTWSPTEGLGVESFEEAAARLLGATEATGDVERFVRSVEVLKPLLEKEQACAAAARLLDKVAATGSVGDVSVAAGKLARAELVTGPQIDGVLNAAAARFNSQIPWPAEVSETDAVREAA